ncbi:hypothetical protein F8M41_022986 [Gigaspora margarita]|uniref:Uncharacterized protein n=1 Tax=Gigaspora margarita TaxID=4874 RepID=A0A8H4ETE8_GIGMA|nr:hypothetical protein F8M41_022986 [Gigaspora margarita]
MLEDIVFEISQEELDAKASVRTEFQNLTNNQAFEHIPSLNETLHSVMNNTSATDEFHMLDVGAGTWEQLVGFL